jgi:hypothetical protein
MSKNEALAVKKLHFSGEILKTVSDYWCGLRTSWLERMRITPNTDVGLHPGEEEYAGALLPDYETEEFPLDKVLAQELSPRKRVRDSDEYKPSPAKTRKIEAKESPDVGTQLPELPVELDSPHRPAHREVLLDVQSPSLAVRIASAYQEAGKENYFSPHKTRLASAKILREFGERVEQAIHAPSRSLEDDNLFEKLRKHIYEITAREATFEARDDVDIHTFSFEFEAAGASVTAHHKVFESGITSHQVTGITSYESIAVQLDTWSKKVPDKIIAATIWDIMSDKAFSHEFDLSKAEQTKFIGFLTKLSFLLFCTESSREPASIAVNAMFLDLVKSGDYKMADIVQLPMSAEKAVSATRTLSKKALGVIDPASPVRKDPKFLDHKVQNLLDNYKTILDDWLRANSGEESLLIGIDHEQISDLVTAKIVDWFGIKIKPFSHSPPEAGLKSIEGMDDGSSASESGYDSADSFEHKIFDLLNDTETTLLGDGTA